MLLCENCFTVYTCTVFGHDMFNLQTNKTKITHIIIILQYMTLSLSYSISAKG